MLFLLVILLVVSVTAGCKQGESDYQINFSEMEHIKIQNQEKEAPPIRIAISSVLSPTDTIKYYQQIVEYISDTLDSPAILIQRKSYREIRNLMINNGADIALLSTGAYISFEADKNIEPIATQVRMGVPYYYGYIVVNKQSKVTKFADLKGKSIAFSDPTSYSGYIFINNKLAKLKDTPDHFFNRYIFTYNHDRSLNAVINRVVDAASVDSLAFERAKLQNPELVKDLDIIEKSKPMGTSPVVINRNLPDKTKTKIKECFLTMHEQAKLKSALDGLFIDKFVPFDQSLYKNIYGTEE